MLNQIKDAISSAIVALVFATVTVGGCLSIDAAAKNGNISEIKSVDVKTFSILGLFSEETTIVTGN